MTKARDLANAGTALTSVSATELGYVDGVTSAIQTQIDSKEPTLPSQTGNSGKYLTTNGSTKSWGTVTQYSLPSQTGNSGKFLTTNGTSESWGTVNQPTTFTERKGANGYAIKGFATNGSNIYVAVAEGGYLYSSSDAQTWTARTSGFGANNINDVAYGNGIFVAVGANGTITTSTDGTTWTARTSGVGTNEILQVIYANSLFVAVGYGGGTTNTGGITYSSDGITWTRKSQSITVGANYQAVAWNGTNWIVVANSSTNNYLYASTPSGTWTAAARSTTTINWVGSDGTRTWIVQSNGFYFTSSSTFATWSSVEAIGNPLNNSLSTFHYNNKIYYQNDAMLADISSTPAQGPSTAWYGQSLNARMHPALFPSSSNPYFYYSPGKLFVNASGYMLGDGYGRIWTSF